MYLNDYALRFDDLTSDQATRIAIRLNLFDTTEELYPTNAFTGHDLYEICDNSEFDHATVVLALRDDATVAGIRAIETLIGQPIKRTAASPTKAGSPHTTKTSARKSSPRSSSSANLPCSLDAVVTSVVPNPKRPGAAPYLRFNHWTPGITVAAALAAGLTPADVAWDLAHDYVTVSEPAK